MTEPVNENLVSKYENEADHILKWAAAKEIPLRLTGSLAVRHHCHRHKELLSGRKYPDLDIVTLSRFVVTVRDTLISRGYSVDQQVLFLTEGMRYVFSRQENGHAMTIDMFVDMLDFCHCIDLRQRLTITQKTISLADLLLSKLQIVKMSERDLADAIVLFVEHDLGESEAEEIVDVGYISRLLSDDWGFYHTVLTNLDSIEEFSMADSRPQDVTTILQSRLAQFRDRIEKEPKSLKWTARSVIGTRVKWYKEVSDRAPVF